jgi:hypothetical protein
MNENLEQHKASILKYVNDRYERLGTPILLSTIGVAFRKEFDNFKKLYGNTTLGDFIRSHLSTELRFPESREAGPRAAVEPIPNSDRPIKRSSPQTAARRFAHEGLQSYPGALVIAFCLKPSEDTDVYFSIQPPFRYTEIPARDPAPGQNYRLIERELRIGKRSADLTSEDMALLNDRIAKWLSGTGMDSTFRHGGRPSRVAPLVSPAATNALSRLMEAQRPEVREKLLIPGDIAELLSKHN